MENKSTTMPDGADMPPIDRSELDGGLGYERYAVEGRGTGNSRNGHKATKVQTNAGVVKVDQRRDRNGEFDSMVLLKGVRRLNEFDDMVLSLHAKCMTTSDISEHLGITHGTSISHETVANITDAINDTVKEWRNRPLDEGQFLTDVANQVCCSLVS